MSSSPRRRLAVEELNVWKKAVRLSVETNGLIFSRQFHGPSSLRDQITRSASSIPSNIAEGEGQPTNRASTKFYFIARGSLNELQSQLAEATQRGCIPKKEGAALEALSIEVAKLIAGVIRSRKSREVK
jgi:four helix bundle protein